jgi:hypothetical protein
LQTSGRFRHSIALALLLIAVLGAGGCGATAQRGGVTPPAEACVVREVERGGVFGGTRLELDTTASPAYCDEDQVRADYLAALEGTALWYDPPRAGVACEALEPPTSYPPDLLASLDQFYAGELLAEARAMIHYNQQADPLRIVIPCWNFETFDQELATGDEPSSLTWRADGHSVLVTHTIADYTLQTYEIRDGSAVLVADTEDSDVPALTASNWETTLVYDAADERWKIIRAENVIPAQ